MVLYFETEEHEEEEEMEEEEEEVEEEEEEVEKEEEEVEEVEEKEVVGRSTNGIRSLKFKKGKG